MSFLKDAGGSDRVQHVASPPSPPSAGWRSGTEPSQPSSVADASSWKRMSGLDRGLVIGGFAAAILIAIVGLIVGFVVLLRGHKAFGGWIMGIALVNFIAGVALMANGAGGWLLNL